MKAGQLRQIVVIENYSEDRQDLDMVRTYSIYAIRHCSIEVLSGRELERAKAYSAEVTTRFCLRYLEGLSPKMRLNYNGREFEIKCVLDVEERHEEMEIFCVERIGKKKRFYEFPVGGLESTGTAA